ncbi:MAG: hypothetical protein ACYDCN_08515 [Bacteroidia bacterium]
MNKKRKHKPKNKKALHGTGVPAGFNAKIKESAIETGKDILIGVIGGGVTGLVLGKTSLLIGAAVTGYGHFENKPFFKTFGLGMMMGGGASAANSMSGLGTASAEEIKARIVSFKDSFLNKLYLDKLFPKTVETPAKPAVNGLGEGELDFSELTKLEQKLLQSGQDFQKKNEGANKTETKTEELKSSYAELEDTPNMHSF